VKLPRIWSANRNQKGFTLVEILVALAIEGILAGGIVAVIYTVSTVSSKNTDKMSAIVQVENAAHWLTRDTMMAQTHAAESDNYSSFPLTLSWTDWDYTTHATVENNVVYTIVNGDLKRTQNVRINGGSWTQKVNVVAKYIDSSVGVTHYRFKNGALEFRICARVQQGQREMMEARDYTVIPRPS
jgi:prepilin-type N-terminal cleavage/methylation domain-containing protein